MLNSDEMMEMFHYMEDKNIILSIDLADGNTQVQEMKEIIRNVRNFKNRYRTFRYGYNSSLARTNKLARHTHVMIESGGITWLFNSEFYPFAGAVKGYQRSSRFGRYGQTDVGIGLPSDHYGHYLQDVLRFHP